MPLGIKKDVETDESLKIIHQNIRGLPNKINDFIRDVNNTAYYSTGYVLF